MRPARTTHTTGKEGFSLDMWVRFRDIKAGQLILTNRDEAGKGFSVSTAPRGTLRIDLCDGWMGIYWSSDAGLMETDKDHHAAVIVDGAAKIVSFVVDGKLCDGGEERPFGWGRISPFFRDINTSAGLRIAPDLHGTLKTLRIYSRYLRTSEAVGNYQAGV
jgi:hypothetical protein